MRLSRRRRQVARPGPITMTITVVSFAIILLILAPLVYFLSGHDTDKELARVGNIGQAYGAVSAVLSALALGGVAVSIVYQARQERNERTASWHALQTDIFRTLIDDVSLLAPCVIDPEEFESEQQIKQYYFTSIWLNFCRTGFELGSLTENDIREQVIADMCRSEVARELWRIRRSYIIMQDGNLTGFWQIVDEEFQKIPPGR